MRIPSRIHRVTVRLRLWQFAKCHCLSNLIASPGTNAVTVTQTVGKPNLALIKALPGRIQFS